MCEAGSDAARNGFHFCIGVLFTCGMLNYARLVRVEGGILEDVIMQGKVIGDINVREAGSEDVLGERRNWRCDGGRMVG